MRTIKFKGKSLEDGEWIMATCPMWQIRLS